MFERLFSVREDLRWKAHPQITSLKAAENVVRVLADLFRGRVVLDPFCGTGTLCLAAAPLAERCICSDIEDWELFLRPGVRSYGNIEVVWGLDALKAVKTIDHDILFTDPPNPSRCVSRAIFVSQKKDIPFIYEFHRWLRDHYIRPNNLMGKGRLTLSYVKYLVDYELQHGRKVILHVFDKYRELIRRYRFKVVTNSRYGTYVLIEG